MASAISLIPPCKAVKFSRTAFLALELVSRVDCALHRQKCSVRTFKTQTRQLLLQTTAAPTQVLPTNAQLQCLPRFCPGCGAFTQVVSAEQPGFYNINRNSVKAFLASHRKSSGNRDNKEVAAFDQILATADQNVLSQLGLRGVEDRGDTDHSHLEKTIATPTPICNRCHGLTHHGTGIPAIHPTIRSIQAIVSESPYKHNHIYHVLDAADFPLSLIPSLQRHLSLAPQRSSNRRAKANHFQYGRKAEMSFIITRSDLLAPRKEQVDSLMPYILQVLRDALAGADDNVRLGNVRCVSSKRGWWTKQVKEEIWNRGGGGWMVGKVNVGKSRLFENIFPKGRNEALRIDALSNVNWQDQKMGLVEDVHLISESSPVDAQNIVVNQESPGEGEFQLLENSLLPPAPFEVSYPVLPLVSSLPGTTASPIRLPFGNGKGELVDLPGLSRGDLEDLVDDERKNDLIMHHRIKPEQLTIKAGQSLLIGGLVRITPATPDLTFLAYPFVPLKCHVTSSDRAAALHKQKEKSSVFSIAKTGIGSRMDLAGKYSLKWDVTKQRAGPLTKKAAAGLSPRVLPFVVLSVDVLIEGCGWIELVAQIRKRSMQSASLPGDLFDTTPYPTIEIFSPDGRHVGVRRPMGAWMLGNEKPGSMHRKALRPRRSMKGVKKELKKRSYKKS